MNVLQHSRLCTHTLINLPDTTDINTNTTVSTNFKLFKYTRNQSFADIIRIALEKREEIYQQQSELQINHPIPSDTLSSFLSNRKRTQLPVTHLPYHQPRRSYSTDNLTQFINMPFTEKRKSSKRPRSLHKSPHTSVINLNSIVRSIGENELRQEVHDLLDEVEIMLWIILMKLLLHTFTGGGLKRETFVDLGGLELPIAEGELSEIERIFLYAAEQGDLATVKQLTDEAIELKLNLNCTDTLGRDVLRIAIENEHMELLQFLVAIPKLDLKDCILHAINEDNVAAVEIILHAQNERASKKDLKGLLGRFQSSLFTPDINGIILAAHRDNYVILKLLLDRGDRIPKPHDLRCACNLCTQARREDGLQHSKLRINTYRALTSPSFIILTSNDPILTAFELSWELKKLGELENEFRTDYEELQAKCQQFATDMLAQTRSSAELSVVLNHDTGGDATGSHVGGIDRQSYSDDISERMQLSRLKLAIRYEQKQFVAHPHCQQLLAAIWYEVYLDFVKNQCLPN
ncbi:unnamed protein product [Heterobilharzia americana]|nr:unnamed protein product [Heterobilharzia americana]